MSENVDLQCYKVEDLGFDDIIGMTEIKEAAREMEQGGGSILLYGPPATGKNMFGRALAGEFGMYLSMNTIFYSHPSSRDFAENLRLVFAEIEKHKRFVLFIDDLELVFNDRHCENNMYARLREELEGFLKNRLPKLRAQGLSIIILAATNRPEMIDVSYFTEGIFDKVFYTGYPDSDMRREALKRNLDCFKPDDELIEDMTTQTEGLSLNDIRWISDKLKSQMFGVWKLRLDEGRNPADAIICPPRSEYERLFAATEYAAYNKEQMDKIDAWRRENRLI